jgi:hypothetical protein
MSSARRIVNCSWRFQPESFAFSKAVVRTTAGKHSPQSQKNATFALRSPGIRSRGEIPVHKCLNPALNIAGWLDLG